MKTERIKIDGMGCSQCVEAVRGSLEGMGVRVHDVEIGTADISYDNGLIRSEQIDAAIEEAGYKAVAHSQLEDPAS